MPDIVIPEGLIDVHLGPFHLYWPMEPVVLMEGRCLVDVEPVVKLIFAWMDSQAEEYLEEEA